jgi:Hint module
VVLVESTTCLEKKLGTHIIHSLVLGPSTLSKATVQVLRGQSNQERRLGDCAGLDLDYGTDLDGDAYVDHWEGFIDKPGRITCTVSCLQIDQGEVVICFKYDYEDDYDVVNNCMYSGRIPPDLTCGSTYNYDVRATTVHIQLMGQGYENLRLDCSCPENATSPTEAPSPEGCFSADSTVQTLNNGIITMKDLQVGEYVLTDRNHRYEPVYSFGFVNGGWRSVFLQIQTDVESSHPLEITGNHLIYLHDHRVVRADQLWKGDVLSSGNKITQILEVARRGAYMPLTPSGKLMVDGEQASAYVSLQDFVPEIVKHPALRWWLSDEFLSHAWLAPYRMLCMGISSLLCEQPEMQQKANSGNLQWSLVGQSLLDTIAVLPLALQVPIGLILLLALGVCLGLEIIFGPTMAPSALLVIALVCTKTLHLGSRSQKDKVLNTCGKVRNE